MPTKYFRVLAGDGARNFQPTGQWSGVWFGVTKSDDAEEQERLAKIGKQEITEPEFEEELKKKSSQLSNSDDFRPVMEAGFAAQLAARKEQASAEVAAAKAPTVAEAAKPSQIPDSITTPRKERRSSTVVPPQPPTN